MGEKFLNWFKMYFKYILNIDYKLHIFKVYFKNAPVLIEIYKSRVKVNRNEKV